MGEHLGRIGDILLVVGPFMVWIIRWARRIEQTFAVTKDITRTHLPFIYTQLRFHDNLLHRESPEHPNIPLIINGDAKARS
jgi:hypothetical protein